MEYQFIYLKPLIRCRCLTAYLKQMFPALLVLNSIFAWSSLSLIRSVDLAWAPAKRRALRFLFPQPEKNFTTFFPASLVSSAASATSLHHFPGYYGKSQTELKFCSPSTWTPPLFRRRSPHAWTGSFAVVVSQVVCPVWTCLGWSILILMNIIGFFFGPTGAVSSPGQENVSVFCFGPLCEQGRAGLYNTI